MHALINIFSDILYLHGDWVYEGRVNALSLSLARLSALHI